MPGSLAAARLIASSEPRVWGPDQNFALAKRRVATLLADVGESRFENVTDWLPRASVKLKKSQVFDRPKARRSSADFDPRYQSGALVVFESCCLLHNVLTR